MEVPLQFRTGINEATDSKFRGASLYEDCSQGRIGSRKPENGISARDANSLMNMEGVGAVEVHRKGKKFYRKRMKVEEVRNSLSYRRGSMQWHTCRFAHSLYLFIF